MASILIVRQVREAFSVKRFPRSRRKIVKATSTVFVTFGLLIITAHRLPAPIQEITETPSPTPAVAPTAEPQPPPTLLAPAPKPEGTKAHPKTRVKSASVSTSAVPAPKPTPESPSTNTSTDLRRRNGSTNDSNAIPKGAVHLTINSDSDVRKIFTFFEYPKLNLPAGKTGLYRVEIDPQGSVAAVTIVKSIGAEADVTMMKAFVRWRAEPGPLRIVDISWHTFEFHRAKYRGSRH